ncbi:MAG TPA: efflux RND transporter periplasmic adaptor subunit [Bryobacteraceae bacterium]|nr:efflux RND transporter periplasmic adaptor subunit [Bryobacteraceae bacterium]
MLNYIQYWRFGLAIAAIVLPSCLVSCANSGEAVIPDRASTRSTTLVVPAAKVERKNLANTIVLTAEFEPFQEIDVMAKVSGYVKSILVDIGDRVHAGQLLATLEVPEMQDDLAKAAAAVQQAESEVTTASDEVRRAKSAHDIAHLSYTRILDVSKREAGLVPQQEVDEIHSRDLVAEAQISVAQSSLRAAQDRTRVAQAEEARLKTLYKYTSITAPFDGVVTKRYANTGSMIQAGTASQTQAMPLVRLSQNNLLRLVLPVPESSVPLIHVGETVEVSVPSLGKTFPGRVARFADKVQESTRTMETQVDVPNPSLLLVPGLYAEVDLRTSHHDNTVSVPLDAVEGTGSSAHVYAVQPPGVIHIVPVSVGLETAQRAEILSGLQEGDTVIVGRLAGLTEGQRVQTKIEER